MSRRSEYLMGALYPGGGNGPLGPQADFPSGERLLAYEQGNTPARRAMIAGVRNHWGILGSDREVENALADSAVDPTAFRTDSVFLGGPRELVEFDSSGRRVPSAITNDQLTSVISAATNSKVLGYWLGRSNKLDDSHEAIVAKRLLDPDPEVRRLVAEHLSKRYGKPNMAPRAVRDARGETIYPDLDRSVDYWRDKFKL